VFSTSRDPLRVKRIKVADVIAVQNTAGAARIEKVLFVATIYHAAFERSYRVDATRAKSDEDRFMHGVFVKI